MTMLVFHGVVLASEVEDDDFLAMRQDASLHEAEDFRVKGYRLAMATHGARRTREAWGTLNINQGRGWTEQHTSRDQILHLGRKWIASSGDIQVRCKDMSMTVGD